MESLVSGFCFKIGNRVKRVKNLADSVERVRILPDTVKVNGDSLSFVARPMAAFFKSIINSSPRRRKKPFKL